jgi:phosphate transport system substrate-binding protein
MVAARKHAIFHPIEEKVMIKLFNKGVLVAGIAAGVIAGGIAIAQGLTGSIAVDGSSTVYPITEAVAEEFGRTNPKVKVTVGISGTGGGFKRFAKGETDISDASRPIKSSEAETCATNNIAFIELPVAFDALTVVVNPKNTWATSLTVEELKKIWEPESKIKNWSEVRKGFPNKALKLYGPGTDSGTFDYFTEAICGKGGASRSDYTASEDDNTLVQGVAGDEGALGYFGLAYFEENSKKLKAVSIDGGKGPVAPSLETAKNGKYSPLSRPLFIYVNKHRTSRKQLDAFVNFYLRNAGKLSKEVGYIPLPDSAYKVIQERYKNRKTGSAFSGKDTVGLTIEEVLAAEK